MPEATPLAVAERLRPILQNVFGLTDERMAALPQDLSAVFLIQDLGGDSLDWVDLILQAEDAFGIDITDDEGEALRTVGDVIALVEAKLIAKGA